MSTALQFVGFTQSHNGQPPKPKVYIEDCAMTIPEFVPFQKIPRLYRHCVISEKIDGTNASVVITDDNRVYAASRTRYLTAEKSGDNMGFGRWVYDHQSELLQLGPGRHYGEWYGSGINRGYGLTNGDKRFALFNTDRWGGCCNDRPKCCGVVPVLFSGIFDTDEVDIAIERLVVNGSQIVPGYDKPEGVVIYHTAARSYFKVTIDGDGQPKGLVVKAGMITEVPVPNPNGFGSWLNKLRDFVGQRDYALVA